MRLIFASNWYGKFRRSDNFYARLLKSILNINRKLTVGNWQIEHLILARYHHIQWHHKQINSRREASVLNPPRRVLYANCFTTP